MHAEYEYFERLSCDESCRTCPSNEVSRGVTFVASAIVLRCAVAVAALPRHSEYRSFFRTPRAHLPTTQLYSSTTGTCHVAGARWTRDSAYGSVVVARRGCIRCRRPIVSALGRPCHGASPDGPEPTNRSCYQALEFRKKGCAHLARGFGACLRGLLRLSPLKLVRRVPARATMSSRTLL